MLKYKKEFLGEFLGTFILVLFGCGSVFVSVLFNEYHGIFQVAMVWGIGVTLAIYLTRHLSCAHLNPAVSIAMVISKRMVSRKLPVYIFSQFMGAFAAGLVLYVLFSSSIVSYESSHGIIRGSEESAKVAKMFGEYYTLPGSTSFVTLPLAMGAEAFGTFILLLMIFALSEGCNVGRPDNTITPIFIGLTVTSIICLIAPLTQAGLNPARDFGPRLVAWMAGWGKAAFPDHTGGFFFVYILAPIVGGSIASWFFVKVLEPSMKSTSTGCGCMENESSENTKNK